jgi:starch phosphorylase
MVGENKTPSRPSIAELVAQYGCGPIQFSGTTDALYERHLLFDDVIDPTAADLRQRYDAVAHSVRDILSQRWVRTERTYQQQTFNGVPDRALIGK